MKKIGFLLLSAFLTIPVFGYEFQTSPLQVVGPLAAQQQRMDDNGAVCGLLVVETDIQNIEFKLSTLGGCGVEKTSKGYNVYLAEGTDNISLTAPGFKSLSWKFSMPGNKILPQQYQARVERDGRDSSAFSTKTHLLKGQFHFIEFGIYSRYKKEGTATLIINTDIPFEILEKEVLQPGSYDTYSAVTQAPYYLKIKPGTKLKEIIPAESVQGNFPWDESLERLNDYILDLSWEPKSADAEKEMQEVKTKLKQNLKSALNQPL